MLYEAIAAHAIPRTAPGHLHELLGLDPAGPSDWWHAVLPDDVDGARAEYERMLRTGQPLDIEYRVIAANGQERRLRDRVQVIEHDALGRAMRLLGVLDDVSGRAMHDQRAQQSADKYRQLLDSIESGFCIIEVLFDAQDQAIDYCFLEVNAAFEGVTGIVDAVGRRMREIAPAHEAHWFETYGRIARLGVPERFEHGASALGFYYDVHAFPVGAPGCGQVGVLFSDITQRKRAEDALREEGRRKTEFIAMLAHELRNPMATITSGLQAMKLGSHGVSSHPATPMMERQIAQMTELLDDLLDINRITLGKVILRPERRDLVQLVREVAEAFRPHYLQHGLTLECVLPDGPVWVRIDPTRMAQVLGNLLANAVKFSPEGGRVWLSLLEHKDKAHLRVRDQGLGMEASQLETIFELFAQADNGRDATLGGLGVGMALARELAEMHQGHIEAHSDGLGKGSCFTIQLPLDAASVTPLPSAHAQAKAAPSVLTLVVIDDNRDAADSISMVLQALGHQVVTCYDGLAGLDAVAAGHPAVVFTDIGMPGLDGHEVCRRLRQRPDGQDLRIVALTGWGAEEDREKTRAAGFDHHLVKPVTAAKLREALDVVMALRR